MDAMTRGIADPAALGSGRPQRAGRLDRRREWALSRPLVLSWMAAVFLLLTCNEGRVQTGAPNTEKDAKLFLETSQRVFRLNNDAIDANDRREYGKALRLIREAIAAAKAGMPPDHTAHITLPLNGAGIAGRADDQAAAQAFARAAVEQARSFNPVYLNLSLSLRALEAEQKGDFLAAAKLYEQILEHSKNLIETIGTLGATPQDLRLIEANLAKPHRLAGDALYRFSFDQGDISAGKRAADHFAASKRLRDRTDAPKDSEYQSLLTAYGLALSRVLDDHAAARPLLEQALDLALRIFPSSHFRVGGAHSNISQVYHRLDDLTRATDHCTKALAILRGSQDPNGRSFFYKTSADCFSTFWAAGDHERSNRVAAEAVAALRSGLAKCEGDALQEARTWVEILSKQGSYKGAQELLQDVMSRSRACRSELGPDLPNDPGATMHAVYRGAALERSRDDRQTVGSVWLAAGPKSNAPLARGTSEWRRQVEEARDLSRLASLLYEQSKDREAAEVLSKAETLFNELLEPHDREWLVFLRIALIQTTEPARRMDLIARAHRLLNHHQITEHPLIATMTFQIASQKWVDGDFRGAVALLREGIASARRNGVAAVQLGNFHRALAMNLLWLADLDTESADKERLLAEAAAAIDNAKALWTLEYPKDHPDFAWLAELQGELALRRWDVKAALPAYQEALRIAEANFPPSHVISIGIARRLTALYEAAGEHETAFDLALRYWGAVAEMFGKQSAETALHFARLGRLQYRVGNVSLAFSLLAQSLGIFQAIADEEAGLNPTASLDPQRVHDVVGLFLQAAIVAEDQGLFRKPIPPMQVGVATEFHLSFHGDPVDRAFWASQLATSAAAAHSISQMSARFAAGNDKLSALIREGQDRVRHRDHARAQLRAMIEKRLDAGTEVMAALQGKIEDQEQRIRSLQTVIARDFPSYSKIAKVGMLDTAETMALLGKIDAECRGRRIAQERCSHAVVFFYTSRIGTAVYVVTAEQRYAGQSPLKEAELAEYVSALRCGLDYAAWREVSLSSPGRDSSEQKTASSRASHPRCADLVGSEASPTWNREGELTQPPRFDVARAHELYRKLFSFVDEAIKDKHLFVVPVGPLTSLPFHVLVVEPPDVSTGSADNYRAVAWLAARQPITVLPSVSSLRALREIAGESRATRPFLGIGNPLLDGPDESYAKGAAEARARASCSIRPSRNVAQRPRLPDTFASLARGGRVDIEKVRAWAPLPETANELCDIRERLGIPHSAILLGKRATESNIKSLSQRGELAKYKIIHFATHGAVAGQIGEGKEPGLILTPPLKGTGDLATLDRDDGFLTASEIATLNLDADWVVLSACNTAGGQDEGAEALSGIARAFFYAGARALLVSHWEVNSGAAVRLTTRAFAELRARPGIARAEALRVSMREMIGKGQHWEAHPSVWAPFVVVGDAAAPAADRKGQLQRRGQAVSARPAKSRM
jgi:CHAT domain-containing protein/tetratricopeptide (TPR) repeat protein